jgi:predicted Zn-dependent protease
MSQALLTQEKFEKLSQSLFKQLTQAEHLSTELISERSQFIRMSRAQIRQLGTVDDASLKLTYVFSKSADGGLRTAERIFTLSGNLALDQEKAMQALSELRQEVPSLPVDPYAEIPANHGTVEQICEGRLLSAEESAGDSPDALLPAIRSAGDIDLAGIYASGAIIRATANSAGQKQWFYTENYNLDYSLYTPQEKAVKGNSAGRQWEAKNVAREIRASMELLSHMSKPARKVPKGKYRTYLAPAAVADLIAMFSWGCASEQAIRQGQSPLRLMRSGEKSFSPLFSLSEDFTQGLVPRFNSEGEIAPEILPIVEKGKLVGSLIHSRTAREHGIVSNGASASETLRAASVAPGTLKQDEILARLGTGLYLSNLHYLNWSDQFQGRITGMTRYACFWVEDGKIIAPLENLRWDDGIFEIFGAELEDLTEFRSVIAETSTYEHRQLGGITCPGALLRSMHFTL